MGKVGFAVAGQQGIRPGVFVTFPAGWRKVAALAADSSRPSSVATAASAGHLTRSAAVALGVVAARHARRQPHVLRQATALEADIPAPFQPAKQLGAMEPLGFFDPLDFTKVGDEDGFRKLRASELKHGRVAMMASVGLLGQHFIKFPGFERAPAGLAAMDSGEGILGFLGIFVASGFLELAWREERGKEPGNFGDPLGLNMYNEEMRAKELNNGRFAMICVFGILAAELASGKDAIQQFGL